VCVGWPPKPAEPDPHPFLGKASLTLSLSLIPHRRTDRAIPAFGCYDVFETPSLPMTPPPCGDRIIASWQCSAVHYRDLVSHARGNPEPVASIWALCLQTARLDPRFRGDDDGGDHFSWNSP